MVTLPPSPVRFREGTHRVADPGEAFERFAPLMPRCGITRIAKLTGLDRVGVPVYAAIRPNSKGLSTAQGKGLSDGVAAPFARTTNGLASGNSWLEASLHALYEVVERDAVTRASLCPAGR
jgi:ribosomal protein S12 methylthiotransferase accessory factor YcaO